MATTRVFSTHTLIAAALIALSAQRFGALIEAIPSPGPAFQSELSPASWFLHASSLSQASPIAKHLGVTRARKAYFARSAVQLPVFPRPDMVPFIVLPSTVPV